MNWASLPEWRILEQENCYVVKVANTIEPTFPVTPFRSDAVEFDVYYTQGERLIGYVLRLKKPAEAYISPWFVWVHGAPSATSIDLVYQDRNVRLLEFEGLSYMLVMRWQITTTSEESNVSGKESLSS